MKQMFKKLIFTIIILSLPVLKSISLAPVLAIDVNGLDIAAPFRVVDEQAVDGDALASTADGLIRSNLSYDSKMMGVLSLSPVITYVIPGSDTVPVTRTGNAIVNVTNFNGPINIGDFVTTSEIPGKAMKAATSGYVLGRALEQFDGSTGSDINYNGTSYKSGKIQVAMQIEYADISAPQSFKRLFDAIGIALFSNVNDPNRFGQLIRYIAAGLIVLASIVVAFVTFSRSIPKGIEAIGRNPLAKNSILLSIILSIIAVVVIISIGILAAIVVLRI